MTWAALVQMISTATVAENIQQAETLIIQAYEEDARLIVLPENFALMGLKETDKLRIGEVFGKGPIQEKISGLARTLGVWIVAGTIPIKGSGSKVRASCLVYDEQGACAARYDKIHLFDVCVSEKESYLESATIERGYDLAVVNTPIGAIGLTVCYDIRFPELYQELASNGAQIFTVPSAFTAVTGQAHWEILLRARAIENSSYVLGANQGGQHVNGRATYGHSMIVDPWGTILAEKDSGAGLIMANIDLHNLQNVRSTFPTIDHHVLNLRATK